jgi:Sulfotransferase domain
MLVLANGAFKSGSTWLREIVRHMRAFDPIPQPFQHPDYAHWIDPRKIAQFLQQCDCYSHHYLSKCHIYDRGLASVILSYPAARVLNISRDTRDALVSHYFHLRRMDKLSGEFSSFSDYYWKLGRLKACQIWDYHRAWETAAPNLYTTSFERLKTSLDDEVRKIGEFIGVTLSPEDLERLREETSLRRLQELTGEATKPEAQRFFRKGVIGEWQEYFDQRMLDDLENLRTHGLGIGDTLKYKLVFDYRLRLKSYLLGRMGVTSSFLHRW